MLWKSLISWHFGSGPGITGKLMLKGKTLKRIRHCMFGSQAVIVMPLSMHAPSRSLISATDQMIPARANPGWHRNQWKRGGKSTHLNFQLPKSNSLGG